ncbi:hypothetical protein HDV63DRAFT_385075 [Trichoderma sp. SZMC 28014]
MALSYPRLCVPELIALDLLLRPVQSYLTVMHCLELGKLDLNRSVASLLIGLNFSAVLQCWPRQPRRDEECPVLPTVSKSPASIH